MAESGCTEYDVTQRLVFVHVCHGSNLATYTTSNKHFTHGREAPDRATLPIHFFV